LLPLMGRVLKPAGAPFSSSGVASTGRIAACGHTKAQMLHCRHRHTTRHVTAQRTIIDRQRCLSQRATAHASSHLCS
jgi:hypothetical protein